MNAEELSRKRAGALEFSELLAKYLKQDLSADEERQFNNLIESSADRRAMLEYYKDLEPSQVRLDRMGRLNIDIAWQSLLEKQQKRDRSNIKFRSIGYAAAIVLITISIVWVLMPLREATMKEVVVKNDVLPGKSQASLVLSDGKVKELGQETYAIRELDGTVITGDQGQLTYSSSSTVQRVLIYNTLKVPKAGFYKLVLPDGSKVWLNALSELRFPTQFSLNERRVFLTGEAYFEVEPDTKRPFRVIAKDKEVEVLGTSFNVFAYDNAVVTTLLEGEVLVNYNNKKKKLTPGHQAVVDINDILVSQVDVTKAIAWKEGYFYFDNDPIEIVLNQLARWYDLEIIYTGNVPDVRVGGSIDRNVNLSEAIIMLQDVTDLKFDIDGQNLIIEK